MKEKHLIEFKNLSLSIGKERILDNISFSAREGEIISIIGPNGGGKSTLAKSIIGKYNLPKNKLFKKKNLQVSYAPQKIEIDRNILLTGKDFLDLLTDSPIDDNLKKQIFDKFNIKNILKKTISNLSGGELQKLLLTSCLISKAELIILDEPSQYLDINSQSELYQLIELINVSYKTSFLIISHDLNFVMKSSNYVICLNKHICCQGNPQEMSNTQELKKVFNQQELENLGFYQHNHDHKHN